MKLAMACVLSAAACRATPSTEAARSSDLPPRATPRVATTCALGGDYRLRTTATYPENRLRVRFHVEDSGTPTATLDRQTAALFDVDRALAVTIDRAACSLAAVAKRADGQATVTIAIDVATSSAVTGSVKVLGPWRDELAVSGVHDVGAPTVPAPCFVPGTYQLEFDPQTVWVTSGDQDWPLGCGAHHPRFERLRVEPVLDDIDVQRAGDLGPDEPSLGYDASTRHGCDVTVRLRQGNIELEAVLAFAPDSFVGTVTTFRHGDADGEGGHWAVCTTTNAHVHGTRLRSTP
jgi:hypothetical protein